MYTFVDFALTFGPSKTTYLVQNATLVINLRPNNNLSLWFHSIHHHGAT